MKTMKFLSSALGKDKPYQQNLTSIYRDNDQLVATDGHRLHIQKSANCGQGFIDPARQGDQFPDYKQVIPDYSKLTGIEFIPSCEFMAFLKQVITLNKFAYSFKGDRVNLVIFDLETGNLTFEVKNAKDKTFTISGNYQCQDWPNSETKKKIRINAQYLHDALVDAEGLHKVKVKSSLTEYYAVITLEYDDKFAVVMPIR